MEHPEQAATEIDHPELSAVTRANAEVLAAQLRERLGEPLLPNQLIDECLSYLERGEPAHAQPQERALALAGLRLALAELAERKHATDIGSPERAEVERLWNKITSSRFVHEVTGVAENEEVPLTSIAEAVSQKTS